MYRNFSLIVVIFNFDPLSALKMEETDGQVDRSDVVVIVFIPVITDKNTKKK
jgi:hypothetical protein